MDRYVYVSVMGEVIEWETIMVPVNFPVFVRAVVKGIETAELKIPYELSNQVQRETEETKGTDYLCILPDRVFSTGSTS